MALEHWRRRNQRGTLTVREEKLVYVRYRKSGLCVPETPFVAQRAVENGEAVLSDPPSKSSEDK